MEQITNRTLREEVKKIVRILKAANLLHNDDERQGPLVDGQRSILVDMCRLTVLGRKKLEIAIVPGRAFCYYCSNSNCSGELWTDEFMMASYPACEQCGAPMICDVELDDLLIMLMQISYELRNAGYEIMFSKEDAPPKEPRSILSQQLH